MKFDKWFLIGVSALLITVFLWGARWYRQKEAGRADEQVKANAEALVRPYSPSKGPADAPVTVVEFLDPECEACGALYPMVKQVVGEFEGKVRLVVRYLTFHKNSAYAASILEAARKQGKFWEALELMFEKQPEWAPHHAPRPELLLGYMKTLGLDMAALEASMKDTELQSKLAQDQEDGRALSVNRTPTFFVNGKRLEQLGYDQLRAAIQAEL